MRCLNKDLRFKNIYSQKDFKILSQNSKPNLKLDNDEIRLLY